MKSFTKYLLLIFALMAGVGAVEAQNYVNNNGFETFSTCPSSFGQLSNSTGWAPVSNHTGTPDYFNSCGGAGTTHILNNYFGSQAAFIGSAYSGLCTYHQLVPNFREYLQTQLSTPLIAGTTYTVRLQVSVGDISNFYSDGIQFHFRVTPATGSNSFLPLPFIPQVVQTPGVCVGNKTDWVEVFGNFVAAGGEQYIVVGNFNNDAGTTVNAIAGGNTNSSYYYLDEIRVQPAGALAAQLIDYSGSREENLARIFWQTTNEQQVVSYAVERSSDLIHFEEIGRISAAGMSGTTTNYEFTDEMAPNSEILYYRLVSLNQAGENGFAKTLNLRNENIKTTPEIFPNPASQGELPVLSWNSENGENIQIAVTDISGRELLHEIFESKKGLNHISLNQSGLVPGVYLVTMKSAAFSFADKLIVR